MEIKRAEEEERMDGHLGRTASKGGRERARPRNSRSAVACGRQAAERRGMGRRQGKSGRGTVGGKRFCKSTSGLEGDLLWIENASVTLVNSVQNRGEEVGIEGRGGGGSAANADWYWS